ETLRLLGAHRVQKGRQAETDTVAFCRPGVADTVWAVLCREHGDLIPLLHTWLASTGTEADRVERAGRAAASMAVATGGRSLDCLRDLALAPSPSASEVAAWCLGVAAGDPASVRSASDLLEEWSTETEGALRNAVAHACVPHRGGLPAGLALDLTQRLMETPTGEPEDIAVLTDVRAVLVEHFAVGDLGARAAVLTRMRDWTESDGVPGLLTALAFPDMASTDLAWWSERIPGDAVMTDCAVALTGHALDESSAYGAMRDALLAWCCGPDGTEQPDNRAPEALIAGLVAARQPGFLRWLLSVERGPDTLPGKSLAAEALTEWRGNTPVPNAD
ncbi:hypothetical protein G3M53_52170, partial [Streptomyces sp. SID7982]|nr:hypothetical protein [Streptomyces sp. SID7982]